MVTLGIPIIQFGSLTHWSPHSQCLLSCWSIYWCVSLRIKRTAAWIGFLAEEREEAGGSICERAFFFLRRTLSRRCGISDARAEDLFDST